MKNELFYVSKQALRYIPGLFSGVMPTYIFLVIIFILTYYSFVELFNYFLRKDLKWTHKLSKEYEKIPLIKRLLMLPILKTFFYDNCKYKKILKRIIVLFLAYLFVSLIVIVYESNHGRASEIFEFDLASNVYFLLSLAFCLFVNIYIRHRKK